MGGTFWKLKLQIYQIMDYGFLLGNKELFLSYEQFPWFKDKTINDITKVKSFGGNHLYWENLDVDLSLDMIEHPERFPLKAHT